MSSREVAKAVFGPVFALGLGNASNLEGSTEYCDGVSDAMRIMEDIQETLATRITYPSTINELVKATPLDAGLGLSWIHTMFMTRCQAVFEALARIWASAGMPRSKISNLVRASEFRTIGTIEKVNVTTYDIDAVSGSYNIEMRLYYPGLMLCLGSRGNLCPDEQEQGRQATDAGVAAQIRVNAAPRYVSDSPLRGREGIALPYTYASLASDFDGDTTRGADHAAQEPSTVQHALNAAHTYFARHTLPTRTLNATFELGGDATDTNTGDENEQG